MSSMDLAPVTTRPRIATARRVAHLRGKERSQRVWREIALGDESARAAARDQRPEVARVAAGDHHHHRRIRLARQLGGEIEAALIGQPHVKQDYGRPQRGKIARARLFGLAGKYTWTLWGAIQASTSPLDVDFWPWAMERFDGAAAGFADPDFGRLLDEVQGDD